MIYFDNAATSKKKPDEVIEAVVAAMTNLGNAGRGVNAASLDAGRIVLDTRKKIAKLFNIKDCNNIAFTFDRKSKYSYKRISYERRYTCHKYNFRT